MISYSLVFGSGNHENIRTIDEEKGKINEKYLHRILEKFSEYKSNERNRENLVRLISKKLIQNSKYFSNREIASLFAKAFPLNIQEDPSWKEKIATEIAGLRASCGLKEGEKWTNSHIYCQLLREAEESKSASIQEAQKRAESQFDMELMTQINNYVIDHLLGEPWAKTQFLLSIGILETQLPLPHVLQ